MQMYRKNTTGKYLFFVIATFLFFLPCLVYGGGIFSYYHRGQEISLTPSPTLVVIDTSHATRSLVGDDVSLLGIVRDPLSDSSTLSDNYLTLYRVTENTPIGNKGLPPKNALLDMATSANAPMQPVFEQGGALLIPSAEIIVGFDKKVDLEMANQMLSPQFTALGIKEIKPLRGGSFLVIINNAGSGRVYEVCRALSESGKVSFAEPNHLVIMMNENGSSIQIDQSLFNSDTLRDMSSPSLKGIDNFIQGQQGAPGLSEGWELISMLNGEEQQFPPQGWEILRDNKAVDALWGKTDFQKRSGSYSVHCAASGNSGVVPPSPVPPLMKTYLRSPVYNFSQYEEVYVEVWFFAKNEIIKNAQGKLEPRDFPAFGITNGKQMDLNGLLIAYNDDCTIDPTTKNGWRKILYRVPNNFRQGQVRFFFAYVSDQQNQREGVYLDDIRVLGKRNTKNLSLGNDPYAPLQYELFNTGQIGGLGDRKNDMKVVEAWDITPVSPEIIVAVIDDGVELKHPDLNLIAGYLPDGSPGGAPPDPNSNHGTSVAGNIGAIRNNNIGVIGTAPNVKIMAINRGGSFSSVAMAIDTAVSKGAHILNNSWGWVGAPSIEIEMAIKRALAAGRIVIFAAGNGPDRPPFTYNVAFPGSMTDYTDVITVGATSQTDEHKSASSSDGIHTWGSSYVGPGPDICAPGPWSYTTDRIGELGYNNGKNGIHADYTHSFGGTSSSTPKVSGIVALMLSANPKITASQVKDILRKTADDIEDKGVDDKTGAGRVNAFKAVQMAKNMTTPTTTAPPTKALPSSRSTLQDSFETEGSDGWKTILD